MKPLLTDNECNVLSQSPLIYWWGEGADAYRKTANKLVKRGLMERERVSVGGSISFTYHITETGKQTLAYANTMRQLAKWNAAASGKREAGE